MKQKKIAIAGTGSIGTTAAYILFLECPDIEIVMLSRESKKSWAKAFDISHCGAVFENRTITSCSYSSCKDADVILITAGALPRPDGTRADVLKDNIAIFKSILPQLAQNNPHAVFVNVTNPVDVMTYVIQKLSGFPPERIIGSGTELDSMRLRTFIAEQYELNPAQLTVPVVGEHGDTMVPVWGSMLYEDKPLKDTTGPFDDTEKEELLHKTKRAGWDIREAGEHSCYAISFSAARIIKAVLGVTKESLLVSSIVHDTVCHFSGSSSITGSYISMPSQLGMGGIVSREMPKLDLTEQQQLIASAGSVRKMMKTADTLLTQKDI